MSNVACHTIEVLFPDAIWTFDKSIPLKLHEMSVSHVMVPTEAVFCVDAIYKLEHIKGSLKVTNYANSSWAALQK